MTATIATCVACPRPLDCESQSRCRRCLRRQRTLNRRYSGSKPGWQDGRGRRVIAWHDAVKEIVGAQGTMVDAIDRMTNVGNLIDDDLLDVLETRSEVHHRLSAVDERYGELAKIAHRELQRRHGKRGMDEIEKRYPFVKKAAA